MKPYDLMTVVGMAAVCAIFAYLSTPLYWPAMIGALISAFVVGGFLMRWAMEDEDVAKTL